MRSHSSCACRSSGVQPVFSMRRARARSICSSWVGAVASRGVIFLAALGACRNTRKAARSPSTSRWLVGKRGSNASMRLARVASSGAPKRTQRIAYNRSRSARACSLILSQPACSLPADSKSFAFVSADGSLAPGLRCAGSVAETRVRASSASVALAGFTSASALSAQRSTGWCSSAMRAAERITRSVLSRLVQIKGSRLASGFMCPASRVRRRAREASLPSSGLPAGAVDSEPIYFTRYRPDWVRRPPMVKYMLPSTGLMITSVRGKGMPEMNSSSSPV